jgi:hypothetical protein
LGGNPAHSGCELAEEFADGRRRKGGVTPSLEHGVAKTRRAELEPFHAKPIDERNGERFFQKGLPAQ